MGAQPMVVVVVLDVDVVVVVGAALVDVVVGAELLDVVVGAPLVDVDVLVDVVVGAPLVDVVVVVGHAPLCGLHVRVSSSTSTFGGWSGETHRTRILRLPGFFPCSLVLTCTPTMAPH